MYHFSRHRYYSFPSLLLLSHLLSSFIQVFSLVHVFPLVCFASIIHIFPVFIAFVSIASLYYLQEYFLMVRAHEAIGSLFAHPPTNINDHLPSLKALIRRDAATGFEATICPRNGNRNPAGPGNEIRVVPSTHWSPRASPSLGWEQRSI